MTDDLMKRVEAMPDDWADGDPFDIVAEQRDVLAALLRNAPIKHDLDCEMVGSDEGGYWEYDEEDGKKCTCGVDEALRKVGK